MKGGTCRRSIGTMSIRSDETSHLGSVPPIPDVNKEKRCGTRRNIRL